MNVKKEIYNNGGFPHGTILGVDGGDRLVPIGFITRENKQNVINMGEHPPFVLADKDQVSAQEWVDNHDD